jgi:small subunit ribosomal protein S9
MSVRQLTNVTGLRVFSRRLTCGKILFQNNNIEDIRVDETGRPLIPASLKERINKSRVRIDIKPVVTNETIQQYEQERLRVVPSLKTFFGGNPIHEDNINQLNAIIRKYINLPTRVVDNEELRTSKFISIETYREMCQSGTRLKDIHYKELTSLLHRLRTIDLQLMPEEVKQVLKKFQSKSSILTKQAKTLKTLDEFGRANAMGKRKTSVATISLTKGDGESMINGKSLVEYFPDLTHRKRIAYPFQVVAQEGKYNIFATVSGGGISSQAEAIMYGISKALIIHNPLLKPRLYKAGLMTRDARVVERKKPGKVKARKSPTWVKR